MTNYVFLYKDKSNDRDCCAYIQPEPMRFECGHYFRRVNTNGACYSGSLELDYDKIETTILSREEYQQLLDFSRAISDLGYGISEGDERYKKGVELCKAIQPIYDKLNSAENEALFRRVQEEEREYLKDEYALDDDDIDLIFNHYNLDYRDRSVVGYVFDDTYDLGYEEACSMGYIHTDDSIISRYFDFEKFGEDLVNNDENYIELDDGRCVSLMY